MPISVYPVRPSMPRQDSQRLRWPIFATIIPLVIIADQLTKSWIRLYPEGSIIFQRWFFRIVHISNSGAAFGTFQGFSAVLMVVDFLALAVILAYLIRLYKRFRFFTGFIGWIGLSLIFAGTSGNLIDRLNPNVSGITDFIYVGPWPAFNVSDSCITVGVILLAYAILFMMPKAEPK
jgi:signal peptidase II